MADALDRDHEAMPASTQTFIETLISRMTLREKIGQLNQINASEPDAATLYADEVRCGGITAIINQVDRTVIDALQKVAVEESRLGIPLLVGRDVIHGFETIAPLPIGQASSWNPDLVEACAERAALDAGRSGVNWTFAPMVDICRDPRWGRVAECLGEDPYLAGQLGAAMVRGFQGPDVSDPGRIAACAKHFVGYGASEGGRDYNTTNIPENELRNIFLPPFKACLDAGVASIMTSFGDFDGVPATGNEYLLDQILRQEWGFDGVVVSDWDAIHQLCVHGITETDCDAAEMSARAGVDVDMVSRSYSDHLETLIESGKVSLEQVDGMVARILGLKVALGLFNDPYRRVGEETTSSRNRGLDLVKQAAIESVVLLKNDERQLPLTTSKLNSLAVIGPMADAPMDQLGTWVFDADVSRSITPLRALRDRAGDNVKIRHVEALDTTRSRDTRAFGDAVAAAAASDAVLLFLGEEAILSGEAHCRADISLPGAQEDLVRAVRAAGKPLIGIIMAGRPLTLEPVLDDLDAVLYAWHPGSMAGPALADLIFGDAVPSAKLPVTFPKMVGQIPIYYNQKNTGRPATDESVCLIDDIAVGAEQTSFGMTAFHLDAGHKPLFPFGFGLSYTNFEYSDLNLSRDVIGRQDCLDISVSLTNSGQVDATEIVQLYIRDRVGSVTRPVRELKKFTRIKIAAGQSRTVKFQLTENDLAFTRRDRSFGAEPGRFDLWVGGDSASGLEAQFALREDVTT